MCGIVGFVGPLADGEHLLKSMCDAIRHRGPDDEGYYLSDGVGLGMRRLAIIDVASGKQPIGNEDGSVVVVFNGEVYNFAALRDRLEAAGHRFRSDSDTECIVHLYEAYGDACVEHIRGMFAFALWDSRKRRLLLARDRVGKKPLLYSLSGHGLCFASELKALLQGPVVARDLDPVAIDHYLTFGYVPAPLSIFRNISKLAPGHRLVYENGTARVERYWHLRYSPLLQLDEIEAVERLRALLMEATRLRLVAERPIGAFLSGGIDSSLVVAAMAEQASGPVKTFSIGFNEPAYDERRYARIVAGRLGTDHHEFVVSGAGLDVLPDLVWHYDEPFADSSAIPSYQLARFTREHVVVALNGDGGDESFGGYLRYHYGRIAERIPSNAVARWLAGVAGCALGRRTQGSLARAARVLRTLATDRPDRYASLVSTFAADQRHTLYSQQMRSLTSDSDPYAMVRERFRDSDGKNVLDRTLHVDVETYLPGDLLVKMDIATMAHSLEARSPFLDHQLMEFAARLPPSLKIRGRTGKYLLKALAREWFSEQIIDRRKKGFGVPLDSWLRRELRPLARDALTDRVARDRGLFDPEAVVALLEEHDAGIDHGHRIWALLSFELWCRTFVDQTSVAASCDVRPASRVWRHLPELSRT